MSPSTSPDGLNKQDRGTLEWDTELNNNFDKIQAALTARSLTSHGHATMALKPEDDAGVMFVTPDGDDDDDGLSWGSAKLTVLGAYDALPASGGSIFLGGGEVQIGGAVANQGLWILGPQDPQYGSPPAGWRQQKRIRLIGIGTGDHVGNGLGGPAVGLLGGSSSDPAKPAIWVAGTNAPLYFANLAMHYMSVPIRIGVDPTRVNRSLNTAGIYMDNIHVETGNSIDRGPTIDIGYVFWWTLVNSVIGSSNAQTLGSDAAACILTKGNPGEVAGGLYLIENCVFNQGNFKYHCNPNEWGGLSIRHITQEGDGSNPVPDTIHILGASNFGSAIIENVEIADAVGQGAAVKVEPTTISSDTVLCHRATLDGPGTVLGHYPNDWGVVTKSPLAHNQVGFWQGRVAGQHDSARRMFPAVAPRFANLVNQDPAGWPTGAGNTKTTGVAAPDGSLGATSYSTINGGQQNFEIYRAAQTYAVGDWVFAGVWAKADDVTNGAGSFGAVAATAGVHFDGTASGDKFLFAPIKGDGEWVWSSLAGKVTTGTGTTELVFTLRCTSTNPHRFYLPVLLHVATGLLSDNEAHEFLQHLSTWPLNAPVGHVTAQRTQKILAPGGIGVGNSAAVTGSLPTPTRKMEVFDAAGASLGYVPIYPTIT
jgi:hypothetical protein